MPAGKLLRVNFGAGQPMSQQVQFAGPIAGMGIAGRAEDDYTTHGCEQFERDGKVAPSYTVHHQFQRARVVLVQGVGHRLGQVPLLVQDTQHDADRHVSRQRCRPTVFLGSGTRSVSLT